jgi:predicted transcriptional regulator
MINSFKRITFVRIKRLQPKNLNQEIQQFSDSLGLFSVRDKERSCYRIFIELLKASKMDHPMTSDELAYKLNLTRGTVVHHLNRLMDSGLIVSQRTQYMLRSKDLQSLIEKLKKDAVEFFNELKQVAEEIDKNM